MIPFWLQILVWAIGIILFLFVINIVIEYIESSIAAISLLLITLVLLVVSAAAVYSVVAKPVNIISYDTDPPKIYKDIDIYFHSRHYNGIKFKDKDDIEHNIMNYKIEVIKD